MKYKFTMTRCKTIHLNKVFDENVSTWLYNYLKDNVQWVDGVRSRKGFTRKAFSVDISSDLMKEITQYIFYALKKIATINYVIIGVYLNYYENGEMYTPAHRHSDSHQLIISLGATRTLKIGKKEYVTKSGDVTIFGHSTHGVPKEPEVKEGRISIALFMLPVVN